MARQIRGRKPIKSKSSRGRNAPVENENHSSVFGELRMVAVSDIIRGVGIDRTLNIEFLEDEQFMASIETTDGPRVPVALRETDDGKFEIAYGHRRIDACRKLVIEEVFALIYEDGVSDRIILRDQWLENHQRRSLSPIETAQVCRKLVDQYGSQIEVAKVLGINKQQVSDILKIPKMSSPVLNSISEHEQEMAENGDSALSLSHVVEIAKGDSPDEQEKLLKLAKAGKTSKQLRAARGNNDSESDPADSTDFDEDDDEAEDGDEGNGQLGLGLQEDDEPTDVRVRLGDRDDLAQLDVVYPSPDKVEECSDVAHGIKTWMDAYQPFGSKAKSIRLNRKGKKSKSGDLFIEYEDNEFWITLHEPESEAYGLAGVIAACLAWELYGIFLEKEEERAA